jgi:polyisoprenyl-teichoic acid--peptidoglycan teichoic acid transferase
MKGELKLKNFKERTNLVLLGVGGENHKGAELTDTIMFISIDITKNDILMLSIPRDLWMNSLKDKINTAYVYGEEKKNGGGLILTKSTIEEVINQPIQYSVLLDFSGFKSLIDLVGGLDINVEEAFEDKMYPIEGREDDFCGGDIKFACRYEIVRFEKGIQHMSGETALKYIRSRHAEGDIGTDFYRSKRQQEVIMAFKNKVMKKEFLFDIKKMMELFKKTDAVIKTDMNWSEKISLAKLLSNAKNNTIRKLVLDDGDIAKTRKGFLVNPPLWKYDSWVLEPRTGNFKEIQQYVDCQIKNPDCSIKP